MADWTNGKELNVRQKLALRLIVLAIGILEPYQFAHQFEKEFADIKALINGEKPEGKKK